MQPPSDVAVPRWGNVVTDVEPDAFDESQPVPATTVTLVEGASFTICGADGGIDGGGVTGLFVGDTRICSRMLLSIDGGSVEPLTLASRSPSWASFVGRTFDRKLLVFRELRVGQGMRVELASATSRVSHAVRRSGFFLEADLADLFDVKKGVARSVSTPCEAEGGDPVPGRWKTPWVDRARDRRSGGAGPWRARVGSGTALETWEVCVELLALRGGEVVPLTHPCGQPSGPTPSAGGRTGWRTRLPELTSDVPGLAHAFLRTGEDLGALRLVDPGHPEDVPVAAGAPWYMTLFGRDSILTSWMALPLDPDLGLGTARSLARMQGVRDVPETDEQPGRILHEIRFSRDPSLALADGDIYYGSTDATPLFVMLVHELWRWGCRSRRSVRSAPRSTRRSHGSRAP